MLYLSQYLRIDKNRMYVKMEKVDYQFCYTPKSLYTGLTVTGIHLEKFSVGKKTKAL